MKYNLKSYVLTIAAIFIVYSASAQTALTGIKGGVNLSNLFIDEVDDENMRTGFHAGIFTQFLAPSGLIGIQPELAYSTKGAKGTYDIVGFSGEQQFNMNYLDLPLLLVFKLGDDVDINVGGYASYLLSSSVSTTGALGDASSELDRDNFHKMDYGLAGGLSMNFHPVSVGIRYNYGLRPIANSDEASFFLGNSKHGVGQIYIAFGL